MFGHSAITPFMGGGFKREDGSIKGQVFRTRAHFFLFVSDRNVEGKSFGNVEGGKKRDEYKGVLLK